ncbi:MAG: hypothetical protein ACYC1M_09575 [Armatimonadota bacterium]
MTNHIDVPWHRYALISEMADELQGKSAQFGKTVLEKMVYLLQVLYGVDCGYDYSLYTYGPFCQELLGDLDYVESLGGVMISHGVFGGYDIKPGAKKDTIVKLGREFIEKHQACLHKVIDKFGSYSAKELELRSTIVYADRDIIRSSKNDMSRSEFIQLVQQIKSHFDLEQIGEACDQLVVNGFITKRT